MLIGIYGASGIGREVKPLSQGFGKDATTIAFVNDSPPSAAFNSCKVLTFDEFLKAPGKEKRMVIAIAGSIIREKLSIVLKKHNISSHNAYVSNAFISPDAAIVQGVIISHFTTITPNAVIGDFFHTNIYSYVAHDCKIGNFVTFAPDVKCNGNCIIEDHAYIGTGAIIRQGTPEKPLIIGAGAVVSMGAVVTKNVPPGSSVDGCPAKPI